MAKRNQQMSADPKIQAIRKDLAQAMALERVVVARRLARLGERLQGRAPDKAAAQQIDDLARQVRRSVAQRDLRRRGLPRPDLDRPLPIANQKEEIMAAIREHQVVIISGQTGSGKSTQIPKYCLAVGRGVSGQIGCTQPRRIAAMSIARRIADELGENLGSSVGYKIRFQDRTPQDAYIKVMTDGTLLAEAQTDRLLLRYDTLIVDEAHERSLNIDLLLGILKTLLKRRRDLKVIITSATLDTEKFSQAFGHAPVMEVSGRTYPVEVRYAPPQAFAPETGGGEPSPVKMAVEQAVDLHRQTPRGDMLIFMPTEADIRETCDLLGAGDMAGVEILPLYARLAGRAQSRVFAHSRARKIIVATNVAETSLTIPGIRFVIDTGLARIAAYSPRTRTKALPVRPISRASADQRKGRCGRVVEGICIRLYTEEDYLQRREFTPPEIQRANLAEVILRMMALKLGAVDRFPFIDPPTPKQVQDGYRVLEELGAIRSIASPRKKRSGPGHQLTATGRTMARIPLDPRLARILIQARHENCLPEALIITAALSIQDPRERPPEETARADQAHKPFKDPASDFATYLNIWKSYHREQQGNRERLSRSQRQKRARRFCRDNYFSFRRMREWTDIHRQIKTIARECGLLSEEAPARPASAPAASPGKSKDTFGPIYQALHRAILSGFLSNVALATDKNMYQGVGGKQLMLFPGSGIFNRGGKWIVMAEQVTTSRLFARTAATVDPAWLESIGRPFLKSSYHHPRWDARRAQVVADQQISLWGLILVPKRTCAYGQVDPEEAAAIFIREALVAGDLRRERPFLRHNRDLLEQLRDQEARLRRRDIVVNDEILVEFYHRRLPDICDPRTMDRFIKKRGGDQFLRMTEADLARYTPDAGELALYPDTVALGRQSFDCTYRFEPGTAADGVTITIPRNMAPAVPAEDLEWGVPGLLAEKVTALIKGLPKTYRRALVPVPQTVAALMPELVKQKPRGSSLRQVLGEMIHRQRGLNIPGSAWPRLELPDHLKTRIAIVDPQGKEVAASRDPSILRQGSPSPDLDPQALRAAARPHERQGLKSWDFGDLAPSVVVTIAKQGQWPLFPALVPPEDPGSLKQKGVALKLLADARKARAVHPQGVAALCTLHFARELKFLKRSLKIPLDLVPAANYLGGAAQQLVQVRQRVADDLFVRDIRTQKEFGDHLQQAGPEIIPRGQRILAAGLPVVAAHGEAREELQRLARRHRGQVHQEQFIRERSDELARLVPATLFRLYSAERLGHLERYIKALVLRAQRGVLDLPKARRMAVDVDRFESALKELLAGLGEETSRKKTAAIEGFHWLLEEFKVSVFAQELKTAVPVSIKRLQVSLDTILRML